MVIMQLWHWTVLIVRR